MDESFLAIALLALATVLIVAEIFIPSGGLLALGMFASLFAAFYYAWIAWWDTSPSLFFGFTAFAIFVIPGMAFLALTWLPKTKFGRRILLHGPSEEEVVPFAKEEEHLNSLVGQVAKTITPLTPGGLISVDRERIHAYSEGSIVESGTSVEIVKATGTRVLVREVSSDVKPANPDQPKPASEVEDSGTSTKTDPESSLDFDLADPDET